MVWMGSYLITRKEDCSEAWKEGWMDVERRVTPGTCQRKTEWGKQEEREKGGHCLFILHSSRLLWQQQRPVFCFSWVEFWTLGNALPVLHLHISLTPSNLLVLAPSICVFNSIKLIYITQTNTLITISPRNNLLVNLNSGKQEKKQVIEVVHKRSGQSHHALCLDSQSLQPLAVMTFDFPDILTVWGEAD